MTTIVEEDENQIAPLDFSQLLPDVTFGGIHDGLTAETYTLDALRPDQCPLHPDVDDCLCNGFVGDWSLDPAAVVEPEPLSAGLEEPDYSRFENWIPRFVRPEKPCDYCRSRKMACYQQRGEPFCTSCATLFRECSLSKSQTLEALNYADKDNGTFLDTLHSVDEDVVIERGTMTGIKPLKSKTNVSGTSTPTRVPVKDDAPGSTKRNGIRFPRHAVKVLRDWLDSHADNPYPTEDEKADLERQTELKPSQIANWLANARRRRKVTEKARPKLCMSPSLRPVTDAIPIPGATEKPWDELNPFERWQHSPPENEPANIEDIADALARNDLPDGEVSTSPSTLARSSKRRKGSSTGSGWSHARAPSTTSAETGRTSSLSSSQAVSQNSSHSTHGSFGSFSSSLAGKKDRRRRRRPASTAAPGRKVSDDKKRIFQCTFCTDTFKSKYDWTRHEKSLHLSLEKWICAPLGPVITDQEPGSKKCVYCDLHNPSSDHIESHNHRQCEDKGLDARTFYRKDHLRQHLRLMHGCEMAPAMDSWKSIAVNINSRCGFCAQRFTVWQERVDHLTAHFKAGARMSEWKGCRGLDPAVAAQVTNAMPPYLIGIESVSPNPFSATNRASWRQQNPGQEGGGNFGKDGESLLEEINGAGICEPGEKATCWEILTVRLGKFAKEMADKGEIMTDEMLQVQARRILYDSDDSWNQTAADNPEWLDLFKKAHGLDFIPSAIGGQGSQIPEDLETYGDLGLRIPFAVQLQAYNQAQAGKQKFDAATRLGPYKQQNAQHRKNLKRTFTLLADEGVLRYPIAKCEHVACAKNVIDLSSFDDTQSPGPKLRTWCGQDVTEGMLQKLSNIDAAWLDAHLKRRNNLSKGWAVLENLDARNDLQKQEASQRQQLALDSRNEAQEKARAAEGVAMGLKTLVEQENVCCPWPKRDSELIAARARMRGLSALDAHEKSHTSCAWEQGDLQIAAARARGHGLETLARLEAPQVWDNKMVPPGPKKSYLQRHRYELPKEKANMFATTTGAWEDSGLMPQTVQTSLSNIQETTSTGAMMEFLGGNIGASLPFSNDALTSTIDIPTVPASNDLDWHLPDGGNMSEQEMMDLINSTSAEQFDTIPGVSDLDMSWMNNDTTMSGATSAPGLPADLPMDDVNFEEMNFDSVFDMPMDETFVPTSG